MTRSSGKAAGATFGYVRTAPTGVPDVVTQEARIRSACAELGLRLVDTLRDGQHDRPSLRTALERIAAGDAGCLMVSDLTALGPGVRELAEVIGRLERGGTRLIALDVGLDTATASGRLALGADETWWPVDPAPEADEEPGFELTLQSEPAAPVRTPAIGYASVAADRNARDDLEAQTRAISAEAERHGLALVEVVREREPKTSGALQRAGLSYLIGRIAAGDAACVVVSSLDRLSRSVAELGVFVQWVEENGVRLVAADIQLDTAGPGGHTTARALTSVARWEHERLSARTRSGLAAARARRHAGEDDWVDVRGRIAQMRADGMTLQAIADVLNAEHVPTMRGGREWRPSSVQTAAGYKRRTRTKRIEELPRVDRGDEPETGPRPQTRTG